MSLDPYRQVLRLPGVTRLLVLGTVARVAPVASGIVLTLHVVLTLDGGYAAAGLVGTATTVGMAVGAPWRGRAIDRVGLRRALLPSVLAEAVVWSIAPFVGYRMLLLVSVVGGVLGLPIFTAVRQSLSVLVPEHQRRPAYTMDSIGLELSFMVGPALGVVVATTISTQVAVLGVGAAIVLSGVALMVLNPPTRSADHASSSGPAARVTGEPPATSRRGWVSAPLLAIFAATAAAAMVLAGTDVAVVAHLRETDDVAFTWVVFLAWGVASTSGALVFGAVKKAPTSFVLTLVMSLLTIPIGLASGPWGLVLAILPAGALCAPVLTATADAVSRLVPEDVRGEAMGWHGSSLTIGLAVGAPLAGAAIDGVAPWAGFAAVGLVGLAIGAFGVVAQARPPGRRSRPSAESMRPLRDPAATLVD